MGKHLQTIKNAGRRSGSHIMTKPRRESGGELRLLTLRHWPGVRTGNRTCFFVRGYYSTRRGRCQGRRGEKFFAPPGFSSAPARAGERVPGGPGNTKRNQKGPRKQEVGRHNAGHKKSMQTVMHIFHTVFHSACGENCRKQGNGGESTGDWRFLESVEKRPKVT